MKYAEFKLSSDLNMSFHCREWTAEGIPRAGIFLVHGLSDHGGRFDHMARFFASKGYVFFAADLRGNGLSGGKRGHFDSIGQILSDLDFLTDKAIEKFPDIPWVLYGQSMGGNLVIRYCLHHPERFKAAVASSPWLRLSDPPSVVVRLIGNIIARLLPSLSLSNGIKPGQLSHDDKVNDAYHNDPLIHGRITPGTFSVISDSGEWCIENASGIAVPLLLMHGDADPITSFDASTQFKANSRDLCTFKSWSGMYHELHNEPEKQDILLFVEQWISNVLSDHNP